MSGRPSYSKSQLHNFTLLGRPKIHEIGLYEIGAQLGIPKQSKDDLIDAILAEQRSHKRQPKSIQDDEDEVESDEEDEEDEDDDAEDAEDAEECSLSMQSLNLDEEWFCDAPKCRAEGKPSSVRFRCDTCKDFDLCFSCFTAYFNDNLTLKHDLSHKLIKINGVRSGTIFPLSPKSLNKKETSSSGRAGHRHQSTMSKDLSSEFEDTMSLSEIRITLRPCGIALLIANAAYKSKHTSPLPNCKNDLRAMMQCFESLGFLTVCHSDLTAEQMKVQLQLVAARSKDHRSARVFAFYFTGHGDQGRQGDDLLVCVDGATISTREAVQNQFNTASCQELAGKPKMLILDCCRGVRDEDGVRVAHQPKAELAASKAVGSGGSGHVVHAVNADWWEMRATSAGMTAPANHSDSQLSPLTHWLQPCLEYLRKGKWSLQDVSIKVNQFAHVDLNLGKVAPTVPTLTSSLKGTVRFDNNDS